MYRILIALSIVMTFAACTKQPKEQTYTKQQFHKKVDSIFKKQSKELHTESQKDLELRKRIETKPKVDELLHGTPQASPDRKMEDSAKALFEKFN